MSMILSVHSTKAFREFLLPAVNNTENSIILDNEIFSLDKDLELKMEIIENSWHFVYSENQYLPRNHKEELLNLPFHSL